MISFLHTIIDLWRARAARGLRRSAGIIGSASLLMSVSMACDGDDGHDAPEATGGSVMGGSSGGPGTGGVAGSSASAGSAQDGGGGFPLVDDCGNPACPLSVPEPQSSCTLDGVCCHYRAPSGQVYGCLCEAQWFCVAELCPCDG